MTPYLDLSNFHSGHLLYSDKCKGELGKLKTETSPYLIKRICWFITKAYSYTTTKEVRNSHNTLKGVPKHIRNNIDIETYKECLYNNTRLSKYLFYSRFYKTNKSLTKTSKIMLSSFEDKRYYVNPLESCGNGHHKITNDTNINSNRSVDDECKELTEGGNRGRDLGENSDLPLKKKKQGMI